MAVKIKNFIEVVLDTFRTQNTDITSSQLIDKVTDLPEEVEERVMEDGAPLPVARRCTPCGRHVMCERAYQSTAAPRR